MVGWKLLSTSKNKKGIILQFHGNAENMSTHFRYVLWLTQEGWDVITFDYQGYGPSEGSSSQLNARSDGLAALNYARNYQKEQGLDKLIVYAQSLGGAIAQDALAHWNEKNVIDLLVLDSSFCNYKEIAAHKLADIWFTWPLTPLAYILVSNEAAPDKVNHELKMPKLIVHSKNDPIVDFKFGKACYEQLPHPKDFWEYEAKEHSNLFFTDNKSERKRFIKYLEKMH